MPGSVLIVDDNDELREVLKTALELSGYAVRIAASGAEAMQVQQSAGADILLTDLFMPDTDGFELIDKFRAAYPRTRIVAMSGDSVRTKRDYLHAANLIGVDLTLQKPFAIDALLQALDTLR
jgi:CheY-like chemotaxis protein